MSTDNPPQILLFDMFGTVVSWRTCITEELCIAALHAVNNPHNNLSGDMQDRVAHMFSQDWLSFAEEWRRSYIDQHHYNVLQDLLRQHDLDGLFSDKKRWELAFAWHRLTPWPDSASGLELLNRQFSTATLSNGNVSLLQDLQRYESLPFTDLVSAENFGTYKPSPLVYNGAAEKSGLEPGQCAMVAAHLSELKAAKTCGLQTIYVERQLEEAWSKEEAAKAKAEGWVDMWVDLKSNGFQKISRRFGLE
ncbi:hypothetical protein N7457_003118 [Penicillium paradoxum]|uniref:uncharacterized protein n=1 Tax=Penicillium paradoxum TaxID=176176 RepID=UPI0025469D67|nr:uncharacterized protein N7457_003118 [Penicillium paradoxum]KAJ5788128.1 hypothetical protein N7457_003118 [Penicillium paradoxum]